MSRHKNYRVNFKMSKILEKYFFCINTDLLKVALKNPQIKLFEFPICSIIISGNANVSPPQAIKVNFSCIVLFVLYFWCSYLT